MRVLKPSFFARMHIGVSVLAGLAIGTSVAAKAQTQFNTITVFGDSYADNGNRLRLLGLGGPGAYPSSTINPATVTNPLNLLNFFVYPIALQNNLGIPDAGVANWAIAGATTSSPGGVAGHNFSDQLAQFLASGRRFGPSDLITINIGGNDGGASTGGLSSANAPAVAAAATTNIFNGIQQLVGVGARTFVLGSFSDLTTIVNIANAGNPSVLDASRLYGSLYFQQEQQKLAPLAQAGVRIFLLDLSQLGREINANPGAYGFNNTNKPCQFTPACATATSPGQFTNLSFDGLHLTTGGFAVVGAYMANLLNAPSTYPAQAEVAQIATSNFANSFFGRLDAYRSAGFGFAADMVVKAPRNAPVLNANPFSVFVEATGAVGTRDSQTDALGFRYGLGGGQIGAEYRVNPNIRVGAVFNYSNAKVDLSNNGGRIDQNAYQFGGYASFTYPHWFTDIVALFGRHDMKIDRPGVIDTIRGDTNADSFAVGGRSAYLFDVTQSIQMGPLVGLNYMRSRVNGYTESGDPLLTFMVGDQTLESLVGSAGVQFRFPVMMNARMISPYLNVTAEHEFLNGSRTILATETQSLLLPIMTPINGQGQRTYGKVQGGVSAAVTDQLAVMINAASTFAREGGNDFGGNAGLKYRF